MSEQANNKTALILFEGKTIPLRVDLIQQHDEDKGRFRLVLDGHVYAADMVNPPVGIALSRSEFKEMLGLFFFGLEDDDIYLTPEERSSGAAIGKKLEAALEAK